MAKSRGNTFFLALVQGSFLFLALCWFVHLRLTTVAPQPTGPESETFLPQLAKKANLTEQQTHNLLQELGPTLAQELQKGNRIRVPGLGEFELETGPSQLEKNPQTGKIQIVPGVRTVKFVPGEALVEKVNTSGQ
jgi:nucleoid DNA-binding protein